MRIIIDAMGGDNAPAEIVKGAVWAQKDFDIDIIYRTVLIGGSCGIDVAEVFGFNDRFSHSEHRLSEVFQERQRILPR